MVSPTGPPGSIFRRFAASRRTIVSRVLRALRFRDAAAVVAQIGRDPDVSLVVDELRLSSIVHEVTSGIAVSDVIAKLRPGVPRHDVSAIVPCYNHARYLDGRIGSILRQRVLPSEIIALDDGSTDDSLAVLERWQALSPVPFKLVRNERNTGSPFGQWAKGVTLARSALVWIAESDDTTSPHFLERLLPYFADDRLALAYAELRVIGAQGQRLADSYRFYTDGISRRKWLAAYIEEGQSEIDQAFAVKNTITNASAVVFRRAVLARHLPSIEPFRYCGDWWAYIQCLREGRIAYHPEALNIHRRSAGSVTDVSTSSPAMLAETVRIQSALWRSPGLSDRSRVTGLVHLLVEAAARVDCDLEGPFTGEVAAAWEVAVGVIGRPIDPAAMLAGSDLAERFVSEAVWLETSDQREAVLIYCKAVLARLGAGLPRC